MKLQSMSGCITQTSIFHSYWAVKIESENGIKISKLTRVTPNIGHQIMGHSIIVLTQMSCHKMLLLYKRINF